MATQTIGEDFFVYTLLFTALAYNTSQTLNIAVQADANFLLQKITQYSQNVTTPAQQTDSSRILPDATILITDAGSGRQIMDKALPVCALFGSGEIPFILNQPKLFSARSTITVTLANISVATSQTSYNSYICFIGKKIFI